MIYKWKLDGLYKTDPKVAWQVMHDIERRTGLTADTLLEASRPKDAPLHSEFEWNDTEAAEKYRREQAKHIINSICVVSEESEDSEPIRAFFVTENTGRARNYNSLQVILDSKEKTTALLDNALRELNYFKNKYERLQEVAPVIKAINAVQEQYIEARA